MSNLSPATDILRTGSASKLPEQMTMQAGNLNAVFEDGELRHIGCGKEVLVSRLYVAVRDANWGTIPGHISRLVTEPEVEPAQEAIRQIQSDHFSISFTCEHQQNEIHFLWRGEILGQADSTLTFSLEGKALSTFRRNRIGCCVLLPLSLAGRRCTVGHAGGMNERSSFPRLISPHQPVLDLRAIAFRLQNGLNATIRLEGDVFEMEDQRNWGDGSYKIYNTPLSLPYPVLITKDTQISQKVTIELSGDPPRRFYQIKRTPVTIQPKPKFTRLPEVGLCSSSAGIPLSATHTVRLKGLKLTHLRAEIDLANTSLALEQLDRARAESEAVHAPLELALHLPAEDHGALEQFEAALQVLKPWVSRWLIFQEGAKVTPAASYRKARQALRKFGTPTGGGTLAYFAEVNRNRASLASCEFIVYSINPQVHAFDHESVVENLMGIGATVISARRFFQNKPIFVSPVTLRPRWNPDATSPETPPPPGELPFSVDPRQSSLLGAAWTAACIKHLAQAGASGLTFYETTGWKGIMDAGTGSPLPEQFASFQGGVFPMYHVFADLADFSNGEVTFCQSSAPRHADGLWLRRGKQERLLLVNFGVESRVVHLPAIHKAVRLKLLYEGNAVLAMCQPETWRDQEATLLPAQLDGMRCELPPFGVARLDWQHDDS